MNNSIEHKEYLKKQKREKIIIILLQLSIIISFLLIWELLSSKNIIRICFRGDGGSIGLVTFNTSDGYV